MGTRFQARAGGGRWTRNTMENTFGLHTGICPSCNGFNPSGVGEPRPEVCHHCGAALAVCAHGCCEDRFVDPAVAFAGGYQECGRPAVACDVDGRRPKCAEHALLNLDDSR
jgi:predicted amidophosphoribosyltransferase